jgi:hypothetical protein
LQLGICTRRVNDDLTNLALRAELTTATIANNKS